MMMEMSDDLRDNEMRVVLLLDDTQCMMLYGVYRISSGIINIDLGSRINGYL